MDQPLTKGDRTRQMIIERTAELMNQRGFEGMCMLEVMQVTGLEKGGIYRHFPSKEDLAIEAFRYALSRAWKTRTEHLRDVTGAVPKLRRAIQDFVEKPSPFLGGCPLMNTAVDTDDGNVKLRAMAKTAFRQWRTRLEKIVRDGQKSGEVAVTISARQIANTIIGSLEGALVLGRLEHTRQPLHDVRASLDVLLDSIEVKKKRAA